MISEKKKITTYTAQWHSGLYSQFEQQVLYTTNLCESETFRQETRTNKLGSVTVYGQWRIQ